MKVLIVTKGYYPHVGGKSTHIKDLKDGLSSNNVDVKVFSYSSIPIIVQYIYKILNRFFRSFDTNYLDKKLRNTIKKHLQKNNYDYISAQDPGAVNIVSQISNVDIILTMHSYFGLGHNEEDSVRFKKKLNQDLNALLKVKKVIAVDKRIMNHVKDIYSNMFHDNAIKIVSIPNFTNTNRFKPISYDGKINLKLKYGYEKKKVIICVRRLVKKNGVINVVNAMLHLESNNFILLIAGQGPEKENILQFIKENDIKNTRLLGDITGDELLNLYRIADYAVIPSITLNGLQEATSISALEAMAFGIPTIASKIGGLVQIIKNNETGILVNENMPKEIANELIRLDKNFGLYKKISLQSREYVLENHAHTYAAKLYLNEFKKIERVE